MKYKIVILIPHIAQSGGVSNFYSLAIPNFSNSIKCINFNSKYQSKFIKIILNPFVFLLAIFKLFIFNPIRVVVNPSLHKIALIRDGLFLLVAFLFIKKTTVFWRGWNPKNEKLFKTSVFKYLFKYAFLIADQHIVLNSYVKNCLINLGVDSDNIILSSTLVDDSFVKMTRICRESNSKLSILFLTRLEKYKGIYEALEIITQFNESLIEFHIVGNGSEFENVRSYILSKKINNVFLHGYLTKSAKHNAFLNSDLYLFPSYSEGMANSLLEAMCSGLPILCTNVGGVMDFFENGKMGFAHDLPININIFKSSIDYFLDNPRDRIIMGEFNRRYASNNFLASKVCARLEIVLNKDL